MAHLTEYDHEKHLKFFKTLIDGVENCNHSAEQAMARAYDVLFPQAKWQPIETAAKDETEVNLWFEHAAIPHQMSECRYVEGEWCAYGRVPEIPYEDDWIPVIGTPTHWMPTPPRSMGPKPPETKEQQRPSVLFNPKIFLDGDMYCALLGENIHEGCAGFGKTVGSAMRDFDERWEKSFAPSTNWMKSPEPPETS